MKYFILEKFYFTD